MTFRPSVCSYLIEDMALGSLELIALPCPGALNLERMDRNGFTLDVNIDTGRWSERETETERQQGRRR